ncbi:hypothetical protein RIF25_03120 [Thermosynechococcaceae cyanobacterium BACA0444]|uniref:Uncharacterized protein n=1 Tax=Pseudocalidococcus azoricus BACA0444 TaxID=2918990 RepID=A0AAE4FQG3_9CYAN|nr:hypothetical protein [Pseudocalidococcus azoricus]MDS3859793.1 hypothetical protein [Pseudocalidococcus azoricus BACA0444]
MGRRWFWLTVVLVAVALIGFHSRELIPSSQAQTYLGPKQAASQIYQALPDLPLENTYLRQDSGAVATDSTLVERFIQYHTSVKGRSPFYRFDWQLTFADYLGLNDYLEPAAYPGRNFLSTNPMAQDIAAIQTLTYAQRQSLLKILATLYGDREIILSSPTQTAPPIPAAAPPTRQLKPAPRPGEADLLAPPPQPRPMPTGDARFLLP